MESKDWPGNIHKDRWSGNANNITFGIMRCQTWRKPSFAYETPFIRTVPGNDCRKRSCPSLRGRECSNNIVVFIPQFQPPEINSGGDGCQDVKAQGFGLIRPWGYSHGWRGKEYHRNSRIHYDIVYGSASAVSSLVGGA
jgi:hypothetical protein